MFQKISRWFFPNKSPKKELAEASPTGLIEISKENEGEIKGNIVFVHGLGGDRRLTWHCQNPQQPNWDEDNFWPKWLGEDLPDYRIWLFGYEAKKFFLEKGQASSRYDIARNLLGYLLAKELQNDPLWFISHSLGGLVVKQMLRVAEANRHPIINQVQGVVFLATPHVGSDLARLGGMINNISLNLLQFTKPVKELEAHNSGLRDLDDWYRNNAPLLKIGTLPFCEMYPTWGLKVVDEDSANPRVPNQEFFSPVEADHIEIAKCRARNEGIVYPRIKQFIENYSSPEEVEQNPFKSSKLRQIYQENSGNGDNVGGNKIINISYNSAQETRTKTDENEERLEQNFPDDLSLYKALRKLNFTQECDQVRKCLNNNCQSQMFGSFLICGERKNGVDILLERLADQQTYWQISIQLGGVQGLNLDQLWQKVAIELKLDPASNKEEVSRQIEEIQKKQNILLILKGIDQLLPQDISEILVRFWEELIGEIEDFQKNLFLFLVDYQNKYNNFDYPFASRLISGNFTEEEIGQWIEYVRDQWGYQQCDQLQLDCKRASKIYQQSKGIPYEVYRRIHGYFLKWEGSMIQEKLEQIELF